MTRFEQRAFYQTPAWRRASKSCRARAGWLCERCKPRTVAAAVAHHVRPLDEDGAKLDQKNLMALCRDCHEEVHNRAPNEQQRAWGKYIAELREKI